MPEQKPETISSAVAKMLRQCANYLEKLPVDDAEKLVNGELELRLSINAKKTSMPPKSAASVDPAQVTRVVSQLPLLNSRADGERLLSEVAPTRAALQAIASALDLPVRKGDRAEDITRRIIEGTIGYRLASAAIQGRPPNRATDQPVSPPEAKSEVKGGGEGLSSHIKIP